MRSKKKSQVFSKLLLDMNFIKIQIKQVINYIGLLLELVKYDLEHKQFIIQKLKEKLSTK